jgi:hypothetical protein
MIPTVSNGKESSMNMNEKIDDSELVQLGIERVQVESFRWGGYRYTNARDAIAAAKRVTKP